MYFLTILAFTINFVSCSINRAHSDNLLDKRSDYSGGNFQEQNLKGLKGSLIQPKRTTTETVDVFVHPHELPGGDYFLGGWVRAIVTQPRWNIETDDEPAVLPSPTPDLFINRYK